MFVTSNQLYYFLYSLSLGVILSPVFTLSGAVRKRIKVKVLREIPDVFAFVTFGVLFSYFGFLLRFPNLRPYIVIGAFLGIILYKKTLHFILAKTIETVYNVMRKVFTEAKRKGKVKCQKKRLKEE